MTHPKPPIKIAAYDYPGAQKSALYGLVDLFNVANAYQNELRADGPKFEASIQSNHPKTDTYSIVILPPSLGDQPQGKALHLLTDWILSQHRAGALICSVCAGAFPLAATGLLNGRTATTHWGLAQEFSSRFPDVQLDINKLVIDDGDVMTAGGLMAWVDLGLRLVERYMGPSVMMRTARYLLVDAGGREQQHYSSFTPRLSHGDSAILKTQHWLQTEFAHAVSVAQMAQYAGLEGRTFLRRFHAATNLKPSEYLQQLRIGKAREMMELTTQSVEFIAGNVGYEDASAFRRVFQKITGLTPRDYRKRFTALEH